MNYDLWTVLKNCLFLSRVLTFELELPDSAVSSREYKTVDLPKEVNFIPFKSCFPYETYSDSECSWDFISCEITRVKIKSVVNDLYRKMYEKWVKSG